MNMAALRKRLWKKLQSWDLSIRRNFHVRGILDKKQNQEFTLQLLEKYGVKYDNIQNKAGSLSGGNIQKLIVAREIEHHSKFLIAAEPTRGVDIGARNFIHDRIVEKRQERRGAARFLGAV